MTERPKTLRELLEAGSLPKGAREEVLSVPTEAHAAFEVAIRKPASTEAMDPRRPGRPRVNSPRRITEVRSLRLEKFFWDLLDQIAEREGCSLNRLIEKTLVEEFLVTQPLLPPMFSAGAWTTQVDTGMLYKSTGYQQPMSYTPPELERQAA
jgi:hypothetical protein